MPVRFSARKAQVLSKMPRGNGPQVFETLQRARSETAHFLEKCAVAPARDYTTHLKYCVDLAGMVKYLKHACPTHTCITDNVGGGTKTPKTDGDFREFETNDSFA